MLPNELADDMYSHLKIIVNELNEIDLTKLSDEDISRKIIQVLPKDRYSTIVTYFPLFENLSKMKPTQVLSKIIAHELSMKIGKEPSPSCQDVDTSSKEENEKKIEDKQESSKSSKKAQELESSSSSSSSEASSSNDDESSGGEEDDDDEQASCSSSDDSEEIKQLVRGINKLLKKFNSKGVPTTMEQLISNNQRKKNKKRNILVVVRRDTTLNIVLT
jgi:hypothetical protein